MKTSVSFILSIFGVVSFFIGLISCADNDDTLPAAKTFVLVHGAWQAPYAWQFVKQQIEQKGHKVVVVELPGHGADKTPPANLTLNSYRDKVVSTINSLHGKVILVGHSMGGMVISATAEQIPTRIEKLVYIGAFVPANGQTLFALASTDSTSLLGAALIPSEDRLTFGIKTENLVPIFIKDGSDAVKKLVVDNYRAEPAIPFTNPVTLTAANFGKVAKYYIHTTQDQAVGFNLQKRMVATAGIKNTYSLVSSHCPFLSIPNEVTTIFLTIAR